METEDEEYDQEAAAPLRRRLCQGLVPGEASTQVPAPASINSSKNDIVESLATLSSLSVTHEALKSLGSHSLLALEAGFRKKSRIWERRKG
jgi:hypothetical protein